METVYPAKEPKSLSVRRMAWRGIASLIVALAWVVFITVFALVWAPSLDLFQNIVILIASLVGTFIVVGIIWMAYGMRYGFEAFDKP